MKSTSEKNPLLRTTLITLAVYILIASGLLVAIERSEGFDAMGPLVMLWLTGIVANSVLFVILIRGAMALKKINLGGANKNKQKKESLIITQLIVVVAFCIQIILFIYLTQTY